MAMLLLDVLAACAIYLAIAGCYAITIVVRGIIKDILE